MISDLDKAKMNLRLNKLIVAKEEFEVKIMEREAQIDHLKNEMKIQEKAIEQLKLEIKG